MSFARRAGAGAPRGVFLLAAGGRVLPATYLLVHSPRDTAEVRLVEQVLRAAVRYAAGQD
jgi:hypothetical protein